MCCDGHQQQVQKKTHVPPPFRSILKDSQLSTSGLRCHRDDRSSLKAIVKLSFVTQLAWKQTKKHHKKSKPQEHTKSTDLPIQEN